MTKTLQPEDAEFFRILGGTLRKIRKLKKVTQEEAAKAVGLCRTAIVKMEAGDRRVSTLELAKLARVYRCFVTDFFEDLNKRKETP